MTNKNDAVLYIGVTSNLEGRVWEHKNGVNAGFTKKYKCNKLVYYEEYQWVHDAIARGEATKSEFKTKENRFDRR
jgi:putative endonuclease